MTDLLYAKMGLPDRCRLGKRVFKKLFHENAKLGVTDKKAFRDDIDTVWWQYTLKPSTIAVEPYEDGEREYLEIAVLQVDLKTQMRTARIAEVIHRAVPYPVLLVLAMGSGCALSVAHKRFSLAEKGAIVAEDILVSEWIELASPTPAQAAFLDSLALASLPQAHFYALYGALVDRVLALACARLSGEFRLETGAAALEARRKLLSQCHALEVEIAEKRAALGKEAQFNRQVELNTRIKDLETELSKQVAVL